MGFGVPNYEHTMTTYRPYSERAALSETVRDRLNVFPVASAVKS